MAPSSRDPFFIVKDEIDESLVQLERSHARWDTLPDGNAERVALSNDLQGSCESLSWQVQEMEGAVAMAARDPARFGLGPEEIERRRAWTTRTRSRIGKVTLALEAAQRGGGAGRARTSHGSVGMAGTAGAKLDDARTRENDAFIDSQSSSQQTLLRQQDDSLDALSSTVTRLGQVGLTIGEELQIQADLLEEMEEEVDDTQNRLGAARRKLEKVIKKAGARGQSCIILVLTFLLIILVVIAFN